MTGTIGEAATIEFMAYCRNALSEKQILKIIKDPEKAKLPEKLSDIYALISYLISRNEDYEVRVAGAKLLNRLSPEMAVLLIRDFLRANPKFAMEPSYQKFVSDHSGLIG